MRLRQRKGTKEMLAQQTDLVVLDPQNYKGRWDDRFRNDHPIHVEFGCGKGTFISEMSLRDPQTNFIGIDMFDELIRSSGEKARALRGRSEMELSRNLALVLFNIEHIEQCFAEREIERIYLNFSDPWPKTRHAHRRLTHPKFIEKYLRILSEQGEIHMKTDSTTLFQYSLNVFANLGLTMRNISLDLHGNGSPPDNVMTEYERKFVGQGINIYRCEVMKKIKSNPSQ